MLKIKKYSLRIVMWAEIRPLIDVWAEVRPLIDVDLQFICLRKQQSKFFTRMLSTPSSEPVNNKLDPAATWIQYLQLQLI